MITRIMKYVSAMALVALLPMLWVLPMHAVALALAFVVWSGAVIVFVQAVVTRRYLWAAGFALIALAFNPILPVAMPRPTFVAVDLCSIGAFMSALYFMKRTPRLTIASVTDTGPRSESL